MSGYRQSRSADRDRNDYDDASRGHSRDARDDDYNRYRHDRYGRDRRFQSDGPSYERGDHGFYGDQGERSPERGSAQHWEQHGYSQGMYDDGYYARDGRDQSYPDNGRHEARGRRGRRDSISGQSGGRRDSSRSRSRPHDAGKPTDTVILEDLPHGITQSELMEALEQFSIFSELGQTTIRIPGERRRAFVQFASTDDAVQFIQEHFPRLSLQRRETTDTSPEGRFSVYLHFARSRDDADGRAPPGGGKWNCSFCNFANYASRTKCMKCDALAPGLTGQGDLTGATDAGNDLSYMLVAYPLPEHLDEERFAAEMKRLELEKPNPVQETQVGAPKLKSTAPIGGLVQGYGARPGSLHRVFLMRDVHTRASFKFGFAEFWTPEDANQALIRVQNSRAFLIGSSEVNISRIHLGVFLPEDRGVTPELECESFVPLINPNIRVRYRDTRLFPSQKIVNAESPDAGNTAKPAEATASDQKKPKKRKAEAAAGSASNKRAPAMAGQMAMWQRKHDEIHSGGQTKDKNVPLSAANQIPVGASTTSSVKPNANAPIKFSFSGVSKLGAPPDTPGPHDGAPPERSGTDNDATDDEPPSESKPISYVDFGKLQCYVCKMQYKSAEDLTKHEKSRNHREASADEARVQAAMPKVRARDARLKMEMEENSAPQYRDRAKERRQMFNRPAKQQSSGKADASDEANKSAAAAAPAKPTVQSKAMNMMLKQGWTGEGLGANGEGRTEVLVTNAYQERAGLGVEGGLLGDASEVAAKNTTKDRKEYSKMAQEKARDRYNQMG